MQLVVTSARHPNLLECWFECPHWVVVSSDRRNTLS